MKFCGIDLHSSTSVVVVTNETNEVLAHRRCPNDLPTILAVLEPHRSELAGVVVESTYNGYWLVDGLQAAGYVVTLANTVAMRPDDGLKHGDDADDAAHLAHLLRLGILPTGYVHPPAERALRALGGASGSSGSVAAPSRCWRWRTLWHGNADRGYRAMRSSASPRRGWRSGDWERMSPWRSRPTWRCSASSPSRSPVWSNGCAKA